MVNKHYTAGRVYGTGRICLSLQQVALVMAADYPNWALMNLQQKVHRVRQMSDPF